MEKKRNGVLALALLAALMLSACRAQPAASSSVRETEEAGVVTFQAADVKNEMIQPTQEEVLAAYDRAVTAFGWFRLEPLPCGEASVLMDGMLYQKVERPGIATMAELETHLRSLFSDEVIRQLLDEGDEPPLYREIDGALYARDFSGSTDPDKGGVEIFVEQTAADTCVVNVTVELLGPGENGPDGVEYYAFPYQYVDSHWVFTSFRLVNELR